MTGLLSILAQVLPPLLGALAPFLVQVTKAGMGKAKAALPAWGLGSLNIVVGALVAGLAGAGLGVDVAEASGEGGVGGLLGHLLKQTKPLLTLKGLVLMLALPMLTGCAGLHLGDQARKTAHQAVDVAFDATGMLGALWEDVQPWVEKARCAVTDCPPPAEVQGLIAPGGHP